MIVVRLLRLLGVLGLWGYALGLLAYLGLRLVIGDGFWLLAWLNNFAPYYFLPLLAVLPLTLLLRLTHLKVFTLILLLIGAVWIVPRLIPDNWTVIRASDDSETTLKVVSFNIWGDNQRLDEVMAWLRETDADLVLLQEIPRIWAGVGVPALGDLYPYQVSQSLEVRIWGDAMLSRYPIIAHTRYDLYNGYPINDRIEIDVDGQIVAVYNIHLSQPVRQRRRLSLPIEHPFLNMLLRYDDRGRNSQIDRLLTILQDETWPFIVGGDFNLSDNAVKYGEIAHQLHDSFTGAGVGIGATWPNAEIAGLPRLVPPLIRIDYIWHSDAFFALCAETGPKLGSDHLPVIATLGLG